MISMNQFDPNTIFLFSITHKRRLISNDNVKKIKTPQLLGKHFLGQEIGVLRYPTFQTKQIIYTYSQHLQ